MENKNIDDRMREILKSLDKSTEVIKEDNEKSVDEKSLNEENARLKNLAGGKINEDFKEDIREDLKENYYIAGRFQTGGRGKTVNSIVGDYKYEEMASTMPKPESQSLQPEEALEVSIKRTLSSGVPVNNIEFYSEVNWNLMNLGFPAKNSVDIKDKILDMLSNG